MKQAVIMWTPKAAYVNASCFLGSDYVNAFLQKLLIDFLIFSQRLLKLFSLCFVVDQPVVRCYYCTKGSNSVDDLFSHYVKVHKTEKFYQSVHFTMSVMQIKSRIDEGHICQFNLLTKTIHFTQKPNCHMIDNASDSITVAASLITPLQSSVSNQDNDKDEEMVPSAIINKVLNILEISGRKNDFIAVLNNLADGTLAIDNIAFHLLLDIGNFLSSQSVNNVRYNDVTLDFWCLVHKLFKGKAIRFFRGTMACDLEGTGKLYRIVKNVLGCNTEFSNVCGTVHLMPIFLFLKKCLTFYFSYFVHGFNVTYCMCKKLDFFLWWCLEGEIISVPYTCITKELLGKYSLIGSHLFFIWDHDFVPWIIPILIGTIYDIHRLHLEKKLSSASCLNMIIQISNIYGKYIQKQKVIGICLSDMITIVVPASVQINKT